MNVGAQVYIYQQRSEQEFGKPFAQALDDVLAHVRGAGYAGVEIPLDLVATPEGVAQIGELLTRHDLELPSVYASGPLHTVEGRSTMWSVLDKVSEAKLLGIHALTFNPAPVHGRAKTADELRIQAETLDLLGSQLISRSVQLALHFHAPELAGGGRELWADLDHTSQANVALCLDTDWAWRGGVDPLAILGKYGHRLESLHLRDAKAGVWVEALGEGDHDYSPVISQVQALHFGGWLFVELASEPATVWTRPVASNLKLSREWVRRHFGA